MLDSAEDPILKLINSEIPDRLWHYTDVNGFHGIVSSKNFYLTNINYLNDKEEFRHALALARRLLLASLPSATEAPLVRDLVAGTFENVFQRGPLSPSNLSLFTASFTVNGDQLSQWRGYSKGSAGVSLGFDFRDARELIRPASPATFAPCVYRDDEKERLLRHSIAPYAEPVLDLAMRTSDIPTVDRAIDELRVQRPDLSGEQAQRLYFEQLRDRTDQVLAKSVGEMSSKILRLLGLLKHSAFEEEREWRFVIPRNANLPNSIQLKFLPRTNTLVPFIQLPFVSGAGSTLSFRLKEVILGPGSQDEIAASAARAFLDSMDMKDVSVNCSQIPYRPW
jgi:hypothetical protein